LSDEWVVATWAITQLAQIANRTMQRYDWDHIDPDYPEGCDRPYQLVCGLTNPFNLIERDRSLNSSKSNRFLPWRVAAEEVGSVPINPGDLCQFLNRETGEWTLEEFMGDWWFEQTRELCGAYVSGKSRPQEHFQKMSQSQSREMKQLGGKRVFKLKVGLGALTSEQLSAQGSLPWWFNPSTGETTRSFGSPGNGWEPRRGPMPWSKPYENVNKDKYICLVTGHISTAAGVAAWQKKRGIDSSKRTKLTPEEAAFIFLWDY
jgi:hypothetical protein